ncbi:MAG: hybrid sensor histidine kinase/response regulator [Desulfobacterales bacterium]|nr:MAG: hybrid sensor histidine kinase/response regulator [Desulfobacterales bacterium]
MADNTILLVDDEAGIRKILGISLQDSGYDVHTAEDGTSAWRMFKKLDPPIVLTDIKMPDVDGIELLRRIKKESPETEVIMFTGHGDMDLAIKSLKYEATDFVTKPINDEVLDIALKRARERISMRRQIREYTENLERLVAEKAQQLVEAERMAAVGQTVTELAHAIKNIANGLKGSIFVLGKGIELDNKKYLLEGWEMVEANLEKIKNLSLDLLNYGKYADVTFTLADPNKPAREVVELMASRAKESNVELKLELSDELQPLHCDPAGIHSCLLNLVGNAIDACLETASSAKPRVVAVRTAKPADWAAEYQVSDTGSGMDDEVQGKIFQSFFSTKGTKGTGIGLMLTKKIVDQHRGLIEVVSQKGAGATFTIKLPSHP